jgi:hypothetical protein
VKEYGDPSDVFKSNSERLFMKWNFEEPMGGRRRGRGRWALKGLTFLTDIPGAGRAFEHHLHPRPGRTQVAASRQFGVTAAG